MDAAATLRAAPPNAEEACDKLDDLDQPFAETPEDAVCTEQDGGDQLASVQGVYRDEGISTRFDRTDGCEIARWDLHVPLRTQEVTFTPTVLFVGAGRHQRRALRRVKELGVRVVAVDRNADAPGLPRQMSARSSISPASTPSPRSDADMASAA